MAIAHKLDIGLLKRLKIRCVSETGWFDTDIVRSYAVEILSY
jgi:hypothetical protein